MTLLLLAIITGGMVIVITLLADRLGGRVGGLLATSPVVSTFGLIWVLQSAPHSPPFPALLSGNFSILASLFSIIVYFLSIQRIRGDNVKRVLVATLSFFLSYIILLLLARRWLPVGPYLFPLNLGIAAFLSFTYRRWDMNLPSEGPPHRITLRELVLRFAVGFFVVVITGLVARMDPILGGAIAVFPGIFASSLCVMGLTHSAEFSARAAQNSIPGLLSVLLFILGYWIAAPLLPSNPSLGILVGTLLAWGQYFLGMIFFTGLAEKMSSKA